MKYARQVRLEEVVALSCLIVSNRIRHSGGTKVRRRPMCELLLLQGAKRNQSGTGIQIVGDEWSAI